MNSFQKFPTLFVRDFQGLMGPPGKIRYQCCKRRCNMGNRWTWVCDTKMGWHLLLYKQRS